MIVLWHWQVEALDPSKEVKGARLEVQATILFFFSSIRDAEVEFRNFAAGRLKWKEFGMQGSRDSRPCRRARDAVG